MALVGCRCTTKEKRQKSCMNKPGQATPSTIIGFANTPGAISEAKITAAPNATPRTKAAPAPARVAHRKSVSAALEYLMANGEEVVARPIAAPRRYRERT